MSHATQLHNRGSLDDYMQIMNSSPLPGNVQDEVYGRVQASALAMVKWTLEQVSLSKLSGFLPTFGDYVDNNPR